MPSLHIAIRKILQWLPGGTAMGNNDPDAKLELLERWSGWATIAIFVGIVLEACVLWWILPWWSERIWSTIANGLIGAGLIAEYILIRLTIVASGESKARADLRVAEANERAAEATRRAAEASLALEEFKAPRTLDIGAFVKALEGNPKWPVEILYVDGADCFGLAVQIMDGLRRARWSATTPVPLQGINLGAFPPSFIPPATISYGAQTLGVTVVVRSIGQNESRTPRYALIRALATGLPSRQANGGQDPLMKEEVLRVVVAPKS
jgi:hypothetical protein